MAGPIRKEGKFTDTVRANRQTMPDVWEGMRDQQWFAAPGSTQHHDRVLRRERMGQKMTPKDTVVNKGAHTGATSYGSGSARQLADKMRVRRK